MYEAAEVANFFIFKSLNKSPLSPTKVFRLTYISYGWYLVFTDKELINESPLATDMGPVFSSLLFQMQDGSFANSARPIRGYEGALGNKIEEYELKFLNKIWQTYGDFDDVYLTAITTTDDSPWGQTYKDNLVMPIPKEVIKDHYLKKLDGAKKNVEQETAAV